MLVSCCNLQNMLCNLLVNMKDTLFDCFDSKGLFTLHFDHNPHV